LSQGVYRRRDRQCGKADASKDGTVWVNIVKQRVSGGGCLTLNNTLIQAMEAALNQPTFLTQAQSLLGKAIGEHATQQKGRG